jgi:hypothetical protein
MSRIIEVSRNIQDPKVTTLRLNSRPPVERT